jgi:hypothetical protein
MLVCIRIPSCIEAVQVYAYGGRLACFLIITGCSGRPIPAQLLGSYRTVLCHSSTDMMQIALQKLHFFQGVNV